MECLVGNKHRKPPCLARSSSSCEVLKCHRSSEERVSPTISRNRGSSSTELILVDSFSLSFSPLPLSFTASREGFAFLLTDFGAVCRAFLDERGASFGDLAWIPTIVKRSERRSAFILRSKGEETANEGERFTYTKEGVTGLHYNNLPQHMYIAQLWCGGSIPYSTPAIDYI